MGVWEELKTNIYLFIILIREQGSCDQMIEILCNGKQFGIGTDNKNILLSVNCREIQRVNKVRYYLASSDKKITDGEYDLFFAEANGIPFSVNYDGKNLSSFSRVYCKAEILYDDDIVETKTDCFEIWLKEEDRKAKWIENPFFDNYISEQKKTLTVKDRLLKARLSIVGLGAFDLNFNGERLDNYYFKPLLTDYDVRRNLHTYDYNEDNCDNGKKSINLYTYDLDGLIQKGENVLNVLV